MLMLMVMLAVQMLMPLGLIVGHGLVRPASAVVLWLGTASLLGLCVLFAMIGFWAFPPWWTPYVFGVMALVATWTTARRLRQNGPHFGRWRRCGEFAASAALTVSFDGVFPLRNSRLVKN